VILIEHITIQSFEEFISSGHSGHQPVLFHGHLLPKSRRNKGLKQIHFEIMKQLKVVWSYGGKPNFYCESLQVIFKTVWQSESGKLKTVCWFFKCCLLDFQNLFRVVKDGDGTFPHLVQLSYYGIE